MTDRCSKIIPDYLIEQLDLNYIGSSEKGMFDRTSKPVHFEEVLIENEPIIVIKFTTTGRSVSISRAVSVRSERIGMNQRILHPYMVSLIELYYDVIPS